MINFYYYNGIKQELMLILADILKSGLSVESKGHKDQRFKAKM